MNPTREPRSVRERLRSPGRGRLGTLIAEAERLRRVGDALAAVVAPPLGDHLQVAGLDRGRLVLIADSAAWCSRARYLAGTIADALAARGFDAREVRIVNRPPQSVPAPRAPRAARLSPASAELLRAVAAGISEPALRASLLRLATRAER